MKSKLFAASVTVLALAIFVSPVRSEQAASSEVAKRREIFRGTPIVSALRPDDRLVVVKELTEAPLYPNGGEPLTVAQEIKILQGCENLLVIDSVKTEGRLVDSGKWIRTQVRGTAGRILRATTLRVTEGQPVTFEHDGGEIMMNAVTVRAGFTPAWSGDSAYLVCLDHSDLLHAMGLGHVFSVTREGKLAPLDLRSGLAGPPNSLYGQSVSAVASRIKKR